MSYIVYKTTNMKNGKIYVGIHNDKDQNYLGSGKYLNEAISFYGKSSFTRETLFSGLTLEDALKKEAEIVDENFIKRDDTYNLVIGGGIPPNWGSTGKRPDASKRMKENNPHKLKHVQEMNRNTCVVRDKNGKTFRIDKTNKLLQQGDVVSINKGKFLARDTNGNYFSISKNDPRFLSGELISASKNLNLRCPHCNKTGGASMRRWHFNNCREKK